MEFRSFSVLSIFVAAVLAQSSSSPYIPSGISTNCTTYLTNLNNNANLVGCTRAFTTALQAFSPGATTSPTSSDVSNALNTLCAASALDACPQSTITSQLAEFYGACSNELTAAPNQMVRVLYDVLYVLVPLRTAVCSKDDNGKYCATELSNSSSTGTVALVDSLGPSQQSVPAQYLYTSVPSGASTRRDVSNTTNALIPNTTTYAATNLVFLFLEPTLSSSKLCTTCTRNIITPYITFESSNPYAPGISNSLLLAGQVALYSNITSDCGASFLSGAVQAAGGLSSGLGSSGAPPRAGVAELSTTVGAILGVAAFVAASL